MAERIIVQKKGFGKYRELFTCLFLMTAILVIYWQVGRFGFIDLDDNSYVFENPHLRSGISLKGILWAFTTTDAANWHPLTWLSLLMDYSLYGMNPRGYHFTNVLSHMANTALLFILLNRMTGKWARSFFVAGLFAFHPLNVESVAWVAERKNVLSTFFWMLCIASYRSYVRSPRIGRYLLALFTFSLGLMAKPMLVTMPFVFLLLDYWPFMRLSAGKAGPGPCLPENSHTEQEVETTSVGRLLLEKVPFFLLSALSGLITLYAAQGGGALKSAVLFPLQVRAANALASYAEYLWKMAWPRDLAVFYPYPHAFPAGRLMAAGFLIAAVTVLVLWLARRYRYLVVGWLWYLGTLAPVIGLVQVGHQSMADRYAYVPLIGVFLMISWGVYDLFSQVFPRGVRFLFLPAGAVVLAFMMGTVVQIRNWQNSATIFGQALRVTADNHVAHNGIGVVFLRSGDLDRAALHFREALRIRPDYKEAYNNLGIISMKRGQFDAALSQYGEALRIDSSFAKAYNNRGVAFACQGMIGEAVSSFRQALRADPDYGEAKDNLRKALDVKNKTAQ